MGAYDIVTTRGNVISGLVDPSLSVIIKTDQGEVIYLLLKDITRMEAVINPKIKKSGCLNPGNRVRICRVLTKTGLARGKSKKHK